jgi:hypothetical protein
MTTAQLRHYQLAEEGDRQAFLDLFWNGVVPARRAYGFTVDGAWEVNDAAEFVWVVSHAGSAEDFAAAEKAYYAGPERAALPVDPASFVAHAELRLMTPARTA